MRIELWVGVAVLLPCLCAGVITGDEQQCRTQVLPANVDMPRDLARVLRRIYDRSPTFRAQCELIARADRLRVTVRIDPRIPGRCRAFTVVHRRGYDVRAQVHLPPSSSLTELVGHEFEHLVEQIEGLDLKRLARVNGSGVHETEGHAYETDRAQAAG
ncbi:MAG TPA: hypothetical protein VFO48_09640, partial [Vicinamibacterales bacterium]|nr:hypothetical protein [Vicinamibacterales bacterium]